jgi:hypothetical protein
MILNDSAVGKLIGLWNERICTILDAVFVLPVIQFCSSKKGSFIQTDEDSKVDFKLRADMEIIRV